MPPLAGSLHSFLLRHAKVWKAAYKEAANVIKQNLPKQPQAELQAIPIRNAPRQPLHPVARLRQQQSRWFSTSRGSGFRGVVRHFTARAEAHFPLPGAPKQVLRSSLPKSAIGSTISRSAGRAPFASTLRPNLTGGTLGRTAGGYSLGTGRAGGARFFSHGPASQAHVVQNVSQAVRAFFVSGQKAQFNGVNPHTGEKRYKAVSTLQEETGRKLANLPKATPGSYIDFSVNPTITALTSLSRVAGYTAEQNDAHVNSSGLLDVLSVDFSRSLKDLAAVLNDLKRISNLGDLPITYHDSGSLRIHFPGCDADTVEALCEELNVQRGIVVQDDDFDAFVGTEIALLFPFAPSTAPSENGAEEWFQEAPKQKQKVEWHTMVTPLPSTPSSASEASFEDHFSTCSAQSEGQDDFVFAAPDEASNPWDSASLSTPSGYETLHYSSPSRSSRETDSDPLEYQGFEGIYRFIEECDAARPRR